MPDPSNEREHCCLDRLMQVVRLLTDKTKLQLDQIIALVSANVISVKFMPYEEFWEQLPELKQQLNDVFMLVKSLQDAIKKFLECHNLEVSLWSDKLESEKLFHPCDFSGDSLKQVSHELSLEHRQKQVLAHSNRDKNERVGVKSGQCGVGVHNVGNCQGLPFINSFPRQKFENISECSNKVTRSIKSPVTSVIPFGIPGSPIQHGIPAYIPNAQEFLRPPVSKFLLPSQVCSSNVFGASRLFSEVSSKNFGRLSNNSRLLRNMLIEQECSQLKHTQRLLLGNALNHVQNIARNEPLHLQNDCVDLDQSNFRNIYDDTTHVMTNSNNARPLRVQSPQNINNIDVSAKNPIRNICSEGIRKSFNQSDSIILTSESQSIYHGQIFEAGKQPFGDMLAGSQQNKQHSKQPLEDTFPINQQLMQYTKQQLGETFPGCQVLQHTKQPLGDSLHDNQQEVQPIKLKLGDSVLGSWQEVQHTKQLLGDTVLGSKMKVHYSKQRLEDISHDNQLQMQCTKQPLGDTLPVLQEQIQHTKQQLFDALKEKHQQIQHAKQLFEDIVEGNQQHIQHTKQPLGDALLGSKHHMDTLPVSQQLLRQSKQPSDDALLGSQKELQHNKQKLVDMLHGNWQEVPYNKELLGDTDHGGQLKVQHFKHQLENAHHGNRQQMQHTKEPLVDTFSVIQEQMQHTKQQLVDSLKDKHQQIQNGKQLLGDEIDDNQQHNLNTKQPLGDAYTSIEPEIQHSIQPLTDASIANEQQIQHARQPIEGVVIDSEQRILHHKQESGDSVILKQQQKQISLKCKSTVDDVFDQNDVLQSTPNRNTLIEVFGDAIKFGKPIEVYLTYIKSPNLVWLQMSNCNIVELQDELSYRITTDCGPKLDLLYPGLTVAARYESDGCYYRALIERSYEDQFIVYFVDYGNCDVVSEHDIYPLPQDLLNIPAMAMACLVTHVDDKIVAGTEFHDDRDNFLQMHFQDHLIDGIPIKVILKQLPKNNQNSNAFAKNPRYAAKLYSTCKEVEKDCLTENLHSPLVNEKKTSTAVINVFSCEEKMPKEVTFHTKHSLPKEVTFHTKHSHVEDLDEKLESQSCVASAFLQGGTSKNCESKDNWPSSLPLDSDLKNITSEFARSIPRQLYSNLLKPQVPVKGERQPVILSHVKNLYLFYIHFVNDETATIDRFHEVMSYHYKDDMEVLNLKELPIGSYWAVYQEKSQSWYRCRVTANISTTSDKGKKVTAKVKVNFVDYGDDGIADIRDIRVLHEDFTLMPILAVPCSLAKGYSDNSLESLTLEESKKAFIKKCGGYKAVLYAHFTSNNSNDVHEVVLYSEGGEVINESMSRYLDAASQKFSSQANTSHKKGVDHNEYFIKRCSVALELPPNGALIDVTVTVIFSPSDFYINFPYGMKDLRETHTQVSQGGSLTMLKQSMNQYYRYSLPQKNQQPLVVSQIKVVCEVSNGTFDYSRVQILETKVEKETSFVKVYFIDYGEVQWVHEEKIRPLAPQFSHLPPQAINCWLEGLDEPENGWDMEMAYHFQKLTEGCTLLAEVISTDSKGERMGVILHDPNSGNAINTVLNHMFKDRLIRGSFNK